MQEGSICFMDLESECHVLLDKKCGSLIVDPYMDLINSPIGWAEAIRQRYNCWPG